MRKIVAAILLCGLALTANAVPAKRGWQTRTQADGTTVEVMQMGDEYYHYLINREGKQVREVNGMYEQVGAAPSVAKIQARRSQARRARKEFGITPNLAPRGVVILVNFSNKSMQSGHTNATFTELCNSENCSVNDGYPSAREYFKSQSNGAYTPVFDVFGPVTLSKTYSYYGNNVNDEDEYATDAVIEACRLANDQYSDLNFADYDSDNDGSVDFVYVIYAGYGEADGGGTNTIWPHNWSIQELVTQYSSYTSYTKAQTKLDGVYLDNYAMSNELDYSTDALTGIGTLCHEFGHVMGLPDFYDTAYGSNYSNALTPNDWDVMDGGAYNGGGHCPPNYSPWEKYFFGWHTPVNLGNEGLSLTLYANGTENYQAYQVNTSGNQQTATTSGECYYIENRQMTGWDAGLPHHGLLIWKVNYNENKWVGNEPNNTANSPLYTIVSASGTKIGTHVNAAQTSYVYDGPKNPFPGSAKVTSSTIAGKPLLNITESNNLITLTYIEEPTVPVDPFDVIFKVNGQDFATVSSTGKLVLPSAEPAACDEARVFIGWCSEANYEDATTAPTLAKVGEVVAEGTIYYAVFADLDEENAVPTEVASVTFMTAAYDGTQDISGSIATKVVESATGISAYSGSQLYVGRSGVKLGTRNENGSITLTLSSAVDVTKVTVNASTYVSSMSGKVDGAQLTVTAGSTTLGSAQNPATGLEFLADPSVETNTITVATTEKRAYIASLSVTAGGASYSNYSTSCTAEQGVESVQYSAIHVRKVLRDGHVVIVRDGATYSILGQPIR